MLSVNLTDHELAFSRKAFATIGVAAGLAYTLNHHELAFSRKAFATGLVPVINDTQHHKIMNSHSAERHLRHKSEVTKYSHFLES